MSILGSDNSITKDNSTESTSLLSTAGVLTITVATAVCVLCSFTAGLLVCGMLARCCGKWCKREQREETPDYVNIGPNTNASIELQQNEAYGNIN